MNDVRSFWKGFGLAAGLAVVFFAGRVSADPIPSVEKLEDYSRVLDSMNRNLEKMSSAVQDIQRSGVKIEGEVSVKGTYNSMSYPIHTKSAN